MLTTGQLNTIKTLALLAREQFEVDDLADLVSDHYVVDETAKEELKKTREAIDAALRHLDRADSRISIVTMLTEDQRGDWALVVEKAIPMEVDGVPSLVVPDKALETIPTSDRSAEEAAYIESNQLEVLDDYPPVFVEVDVDQHTVCKSPNGRFLMLEAGRA